MKILCKCGQSILDVGDFQENKAYLIPDENWETFMESIDSGQSPWDVSRAIKRPLLQCHECSRLYIQNKDGDYVSFKTEQNESFGILKGT